MDMMWLISLLIFVMVLLGGITRLSGSGLSIMEWKPLMGALPPMSMAEWERVFALYREISQYKNVNHGMSLAEFQGIFWWEYSHRLWGRLIGVVFFLPFLFFLVKGYLRRAWAPKLGAIFDAKKIEVAGGAAAFNALPQGPEMERVLGIAAQTSFRDVAILPAILLIVFAGIWFYDRSRGGFKAEALKRTS